MMMKSCTLNDVEELHFVFLTLTLCSMTSPSPHASVTRLSHSSDSLLKSRLDTCTSQRHQASIHTEAVESRRVCGKRKAQLPNTHEQSQAFTEPSVGGHKRSTSDFWWRLGREEGETRSISVAIETVATKRTKASPDERRQKWDHDEKQRCSKWRVEGEMWHEFLFTTEWMS